MEGWGGWERGEQGFEYAVWEERGGSGGGGGRAGDVYQDQEVEKEFGKSGTRITLQ